MAEKEYPEPRFPGDAEAEAKAAKIADRRERSRQKVQRNFPGVTAYVKDVVEKRLGMKVRIVGAIEDGKIIGKVAPDLVASEELKNGGPLKRINPDPDKED